MIAGSLRSGAGLLLAAMGIRQRDDDQLTADQARGLDRVLALADDLLPVIARRSARVDRDDALVGGAERGDEVERRAVVAEELVLGVVLIDQRDGLPAR